MENKIAILINWPREIDMYYRLIKAIPTKKIEIIDGSNKKIPNQREIQILLTITTKIYAGIKNGINKVCY